MGHYEERLAADKRALRERVTAVAKQVERAVGEAVQGLLAAEQARCYEIILGDLAINREIRAIDQRCHAFVARHLPSAGHLRFVSSVMRMTVALERIGDYAVTIAREAVQLRETPPRLIAEQIAAQMEQACSMLSKSMKAFGEQDVELARETKPLGRDVHRAYDQVFRELVRDDFPRSNRDRFGLLSVFSRLERVSDQAKNICEETIFELTGESKPPKIYRVLFVDHTNTVLGPFATAIARKAFPESGRYSSAGYAPGEALLPELESAAEQLGLDVSTLGPSALPATRDELAQYHVIVLLSPNCRSHLPELPFHTVCLQWELGRMTDDDGQVRPDRLIEIGQELSAAIRELMVTLRGEDAA